MSRSRTRSDAESGPSRGVVALIRRNVKSIFSRLRAATPEMGRFAVYSALTLGLTWAIFPSRAMWPLAMVCLAPWVVAVCRAERPWIVHWGSFFVGWAFFLINLYWLYPVTGLGYVALAFYLAIYWPAAAWAIRTGRRAGIGLTWTLPVAWVACEYMRAWVMSGFPWLFLSHSFYLKPAFIQIADITGAYGVTFLAAMFNGLLCDLVLRRRPMWSRGASEDSAGLVPVLSRRQLISACVATLGLLIGIVSYGEWRVWSSQFEEGPRVAVVQEDFPLAVTAPMDHPFIVLSRYLSLGGQAALEGPDLVVFPETVSNIPINIEFVEMQRPAVDELAAQSHLYGALYHRAFSAFARGDYETVNAVIEQLETRMRRALPELLPPEGLPRLPGESGPPVTVVVGSLAIELFPEATYPRQKKFNSAIVYDPDGAQRRERYDKIHLVPFGEMVPFRNAKIWMFELHWLYRQLNSLSPFSDGGRVEYSLWPGSKATVFHLKAGERVWRFGAPICYEDVMPYVVRGYVWRQSQRRVDFLLNISNDGWFLHSDELPQHLAACVFRAVENRVGIARAVNTGMSGFIDPNGKIRTLVERDGVTLAPGITGFAVENILVDTRASLYGRYGDWFAKLCLVLTSLLWLGAIITRWAFALRRRLTVLRRRRAARQAE